MTPATIKKHLNIADNLIKGEFKDLMYIRSLYEKKLCPEAKNYIHKETKTRTYNNLLEKIGFKNKQIKLDEELYSHCNKTGVFYQDFVSSAFVPTFLEISKNEYQKLIKNNSLKPAGYESINLYGRSVDIPYFDINYLYNYFLHEISSEDRLILDLKNKYPLFKINKKLKIISFKYQILPTLFVEFKEKYEDIKNKKESFADIVSILNEIETKILFLDSLKLSKKMEKLILSYPYLFIDKKNNSITLEKENNKILDFSLEQKISYEQAISISKIKEIPFSYDENKDILLYYPAMNNKKRKFKFILGPTNSGKTYEAMEHLKRAKSGIYLGPLRMLAQEKYEELKEKNIPTSLITGEQKIIDISASHISGTVEIVNPDEKYEVGVIDEIQMLSDPERGKAWLKAVLSLNADTVYLLGSDNSEYLNLIITILKKYNIEYHIEIKTRLSKLSSMSKSVNDDNLKQGDVIVAFDRNTLFLIAKELQSKKCSLLFGDLPYETKLTELEKFKNGNTDILITTDAIAMGINLPIKRVLFYKLYKYEGVNFSIDSELFYQIAGRAGRYKEDGFYGIYDSPFVDSNLHPEDFSFLSENNYSIYSNLIKCNDFKRNIEYKEYDFSKFYYDYDDYLLKKLEKENLNYFQVLHVYKKTIPFSIRNDNLNINLIQDIVKVSKKEGLYYILSLSPNNDLFKKSSINEYIKSFNLRNNNVFIDEKIINTLKIISLSKKINEYLENKEDYSCEWSFYARNLNFKRYEYYDDDYYY